MKIDALGLATREDVCLNALIAFSRAIDRATALLGRAAAWLIVAAVLISTINAIIRKLFDMSSNTWLELQWVLFGAVFLLCASWTLQMNEHIRIDIISSRLSKRTRDWIEVFGNVFFLMPLCLVMIYTSVPFAVRAYVSSEYSSSAGGLILWPAKVLIPACFIILLAQSVSELIKRIAIMQGLMEDPHADAPVHGTVE